MNEKALIEAFERVVCRDHPNPDRLDCPGTPVLQQFAMQPDAFASSPLLKHIGHCAPCLQELKQLRQVDQRNAKEIA